jgi:hypothetical protein
MSEKENQKDSKESAITQSNNKKEDEKQIEVTKEEKEFHEKQYLKFVEMAKKQNIPMFYMEVHNK